MHIIDPHNKEILKVTNLESALKQAETFKSFGNDENEFERKQNQYWENIYNQLLELKKKIV